MSDPVSKLHSPDLEHKQLIRALKAENLKLQKKIARLEAKIVTLTNRIAVKPKAAPDYDSMSTEALEARANELLQLYPELAKGKSHG